MKRAKKYFKALGIVVVVLVILVLAFIIWFYNSPASNFKTSLADKLPFPAVFVGGRPIYIKDVSATNNLNQLIQQQQTAVVADKYGVSVGQSQLDSQFNLLKQQTANFPGLINQYGLTENSFKTSVLKPELLQTNLEVWFNSQSSLNPDVYSLANSFKQQVMATSATSSLFSNLAMQYSQDNATKTFGGDLGFVPTGNVWPEFQAMFDSAKIGDVQIVPGRDGLYIFQIVAKDNNGPNSGPRVETREIYLKTSGFDDWFNSEIKNIKIIKIY